MFNKNSTRVFISFSFLILICFGGLATFFIRESLKREEIYLQDLLSSRALLSASDLEKSLTEPMKIRLRDREPKALKNFETSLREQDLSVVYDKPEGNLEILGRFKNLVNASTLNPSLPGAGSIVTKCEVNQIEGRCSFTRMTDIEAWLFDFLPQSQFSYVFRQHTYSLLPYLLGMLVLVGLLSFFFAQAINAPLRRFVKAAQTISSGNYRDFKMGKKEVAEFENLRTAFVSMVKAIQDREEKIKKAAAQLAHSERLATIGQLGASIAHELKNPMMAMKGYAKILQTKVVGESEKEAAEIIGTEVNRCENILQQMLRFARRESEEKIFYSVREVIESTCLLLKAEAKSRRIQIKMKLIQEGDHLFGNPQQLQQVFMNLLLNAFQASPEGAEVEIETQLKAQEEIEIIISDHGKGISLENKEKIFEAFFTTKESGEGSGLGLSIVREIVRSQGGRVEFESEPGKGTSFQLYLPLAKEAA